MKKKAKRYLRRHYHPSFGYYTGGEIVKKQETRMIRNDAPGIYGRPDLCSEHEESDLPLAMTVEDAKQFFEQHIPFAFISINNRAGWQEAESYERMKDEIPDFGRVRECYEEIVAGKLRYV
jgi:hypothetical protein